MTIEAQLRHHITRWKTETRLSACPNTEHPSYQAIIALGEAVLPALFEEMVQRPGWYFHALRAITGGDPPPEAHAGQLFPLTRDWLEWAEAHGYITVTARLRSLGKQVRHDWETCLMR